MTMKEFKATGNGNFVLKENGFAISFQPNTEAHGGIFAGDTKQETALMPDSGGYLILNGDFRRQYAKLANKGYQACLDFYNSQKAEHRSSWSTDEVEE